MVPALPPTSAKPGFSMRPAVRRHRQSLISERKRGAATSRLLSVGLSRLASRSDMRISSGHRLRSAFGQRLSSCEDRQHFLTSSAPGCHCCSVQRHALSTSCATSRQRSSQTLREPMMTVWQTLVELLGGRVDVQDADWDHARAVAMLPASLGARSARRGAHRACGILGILG